MSGDADWKPNTGQKIEKLYAWIAEEGDGEGVIATTVPGQEHEIFMPLIGANRDRIESLRHVAERAAKVSGKTVYLKVFSYGVVIDKVAPGEPS